MEFNSVIFFIHLGKLCWALALAKALLVDKHVQENDLMYNNQFN